MNTTIGTRSSGRVKAMVAKVAATAVLAGALFVAGPTLAQAQGFGVVLQYPAYDDGRREYYEHEQHERAEQYARQQAYLQQQAYARQQAFYAHERWEQERRYDGGHWSDHDDHHDGWRGGDHDDHHDWH